MRTPPRRYTALLALLLTMLLLSFAAPSAAEAPPGTPFALGLVHVNSAESPQRPTRLALGVEAGATYDRFPLYWNSVERTRGRFDWARADKALRDNEAAGLQTLLVLLGTAEPHYPGTIPRLTDVNSLRATGINDPARLYVDSQRCDVSDSRPPLGLDLPIFADGSDQAAPGKAINPDNPWANYVHLVALRYAPGGEADTHVTTWEIWNEPDLCQFWSGTPRQYARLLKTAYLVIKQVDPDATVLWGGLAHFQQPEFLPALVLALAAEPEAARYDGFFDGAATHQYADVTRGYHDVQQIRRALDGVGWGDKAIWTTESGIPVCGDEIGPPCPVDHRADAASQAAYIWQNIAFTRLAGGGPLFHFQLFDDCGNENRTAPPADAFGLITNEASARCVPHRAETRPGYTAFQLAARYLATGDLIESQRLDGELRTFVFYDRTAGERRTLLFTLGEAPIVVDLPASAETAFAMQPDGQQWDLVPDAGYYRVALEGSTNPRRAGSGTYIGGTPVLIVEQVGIVDTTPLPLPADNEADNAPTTPPAVEDAAPTVAEAAARIDSAPLPALDTTVPTVAMDIVRYDGTLFEVGWQATDESGIPDGGVELWIQVDGSDWLPYLVGLPARGSTFVQGGAGAHYRFALYVADWRGNASDLDPSTAVEITLGDTLSGR